MRRGLVHVLAWSLATGAAVTLSWWGVHTVMAGTAYDPPRALPITAARATTQESRPRVSSTARTVPPSPPASRPAPSSSAPSSSPGRRASGSPRTPAASASPSAGSSGRIRSYDSDGGRVVFDIGSASASLVSATPKAGWSMQWWKTESWIRVEFSSGADRVSVFCTWHDGPPRVEVGTY
ncbi:hypothetical protein C3489_06570 [Streptomyces sp. Ru71]|uniref:hypothetical protein n=1 Tax=Streptomyces sp. Ru71 TaxID=2080746 RepID=UPI000CDDC9D5|nr:hypothetical protein [Streptomyces sp. Ru71]POX56093.1 hypothetical protein C3489_06570 [Streptomyces sp. Ru71]